MLILTMPIESPEDLLDEALVDDLMRAGQHAGGRVPIKEILDNHPEISSRLHDHSPLSVAATFSGLLTLPDLHGNCLRLEALVHIGLYSPQGRKGLRKETAAHLFRALGTGICGRLEDPPEDVFVSLVGTESGNFRVLEGIWETNGFFLQRFVNAIESAARGNANFEPLRRITYSLLALSDAVCERSGLSPYQRGISPPLPALTKPIVDKLPDLRRRVIFTETDLESLGIDIGYLEPFVFSPSKRSSICDESICNSALERQPLAYDGKQVYLLLPTAISIAIRHLALGIFVGSGARDIFVDFLAHDYKRLLSTLPFLADVPKVPIHFKRQSGAMVSSSTVRVDHGRYVNLTLFCDTLQAVETTGITGQDPEAARIERCVASAVESVCNKENLPDFREGLCIVVGCGVGRTVEFDLPELPPDWMRLSISAADLATLNGLGSFGWMPLWRLLQTEDRLSEAGVYLQNLSGLLNLISWAQSQNGHLVPHAELPDDFIHEGRESIISIPQNGLLDLRTEVQSFWRAHKVRNTEGRFVSVQKDARSLFDEDNHLPLYASDSGPGEKPAIVFETPNRSFWATVDCEHDVDGRQLFERWSLLKTWVGKLAPVLDRELPDLPRGAVALHVTFQVIEGAMRDLSRVDKEQLDGAISVTVNPTNRLVSLYVGRDFEAGLFDPINTAERTLVRKAVEGFIQLSGRQPSAALVVELADMTVQNTAARHAHRWHARTFRDFVPPPLRGRPPTITNYDAALIKLGVGWLARAREEGATIEGKEECVRYLNTLVSKLEQDLCSDVRSFNRQSLVKLCLDAHECAAVDRGRWEKTTSALLGIHHDKVAAQETIAEHQYGLNAVFQSARLVAEMAMAESPTDDGIDPGLLDLSYLMAKMLHLVGLGGWSDTIRWDAMEPFIKISALGDVQARKGPFDDMKVQFGRRLNDDRIEVSVDNYPTHFHPPTPVATVEDAFEPEFLLAWHAEFAFSVDEARCFADALEDIGLAAHEMVFAIRRSDLLQRIVEDAPRLQNTASKILEEYLFPARSSFRPCPTGYRERDIDLWRFRRRLGLLRKPLLPVTVEDDPLLLVSPGFFRDGLVYTLGLHHRGDLWTFRSQKMSSWVGKAMDARGRAFSSLVGEKLTSLGWDVEIEVPVTKLLRKGFNRDYGDVDVVAWSRTSHRLLLIECKDVQFRKTDGEIAEQLSDFQGEVKADGKPDLLRKHLDRVEIIREHRAQLTTFDAEAQIEGHLVFKNPVPMAYAWNRLQTRMPLSLFDELDRI